MAAPKGATDKPQNGDRNGSERWTLADEPNLVLEHLRAIRSVVERTQLDIMELKSRVTSLEVILAQVLSQQAVLSQRMDRLDERVSRIERRLELTEA